MICSEDMKKIVCLTVFVLLLGYVANAGGLRIGKRPQKEVVEKGSVEYFSKPFSGVFDVKATNSRYNDDATKWRFCEDGTAVLFHNVFYPVYECYYYTVENGVIKLDGVCTVQYGLSLHMLAEKPAGVELHVTSYGPNAILEGAVVGKKGNSYSLTMSSSDYIDRYGDKNFAGIMACRAHGITSTHENLWLVTGEYGAPACLEPDTVDNIVNFSRGDIFQGKLSDDGNFVIVDYIDDSKLYVNIDDVKAVKNEAMLQDILYKDAEAGLDFVEWQATFPEKEWKVDTSGYFNGWKAGRLAAEAFLPFMAVMLILLILNKIYPPFYPNFLFCLTYVVLVFLTLFELWYAISLKQDMFWFIFSPKDFVHGFAAVVGTLVLFCLQIFLILTMEESLGDIYSAYTRCPFWVELVLYGAALYVSIPIMLSGMSLKMLYVYLLLLAACLPTSIGYLIHSRNKVAVLPFLLLCYPLKYIVMLPFLIFYVFKQASSTKVTVASDEDPDHVTVRDMEGNMVNLTRMPNGDMLDNDGHPYLKGGDGSFYPTGVDRTDGPYR